MTEIHNTLEVMPQCLYTAVHCTSTIVQGRAVTPDEVSAMIKAIHSTIIALANPEPIEQEPARVTPAVPVKKSITDEYLVCLHDGRKFKSLKRHLATAYNQTPDQYRAMFGLPSDYPMVAPGYSKKRSALAHSIGLGRIREVDNLAA